MRKRTTEERLLVAGTLVQASNTHTEAHVFLPTVLHEKARAQRTAWLAVFVLRRNYMASLPDPRAVSEQLRDAPPIDSASSYWEVLYNSLRDRESAAVQFLLGHPDVIGVFDKHASPPQTSPATPQDAAAPLPEQVEEAPSDSLEMDVLVSLGPVSASASAGYADLDHQTFFKLRGISGKGKLVWSRSDKGREKNAKVYAELHVQRITLGVINSILQYGVVYQRSVGNWITTRNIELAKRAAVSDSDPLGNRQDVAATAKKAVMNDSDKSSTLFEIVGATVRVDPIRLQGVSDSGCALLELDGITAVYSHVQSISGGRRVHSSDHMEHFAVVTMKRMGLSLYGTPSPDRKKPREKRIAELSIQGFKLTELKLVQVNSITRRSVDVYSVFANVDKVDVPFNVGNARKLGHFLREWTLETARIEGEVDDMWGGGGGPNESGDRSAHVSAASEALPGSKQHPSLILKVCVLADVSCPPLYASQRALRPPPAAHQRGARLHGVQRLTGLPLRVPWHWTGG